jgi:hypothetical protein
MLSVANKLFILSIVKLSVVKLSVVMLSVVMLIVVAPSRFKSIFSTLAVNSLENPNYFGNISCQYQLPGANAIKLSNAITYQCL